MRASAQAKTTDQRNDARPADDKQVDVWVSCTPLDYPRAQQLARALFEQGFTCAPSHVIDRGDAMQRNLTPNDARCVIVVWSPPAVDVQQMQADARTAGNRGALIEIAFHGASPVERFSDEALISFRRTENILNTQQGRQLLARVRDLCGSRKKPVDVLRFMPAAVATATAVLGVGGAAVMLADHARETQHATETENWVEPPAMQPEPALLAVAKRPSMTPTADLDLNLAAGGPNEYIAEDLGTDPKGAAPLSVPLETPPPPPQRAVQGPDQ